MKTPQELIKSHCAEDKEEKDFFVSLATELYNIERNGNKDTHAQKLAYLFSNHVRSAKRLLSYYADHSQASQPLHDLCMTIFMSEKPLIPLYRFGEGRVNFLFLSLNDLEIFTRYHERILTKNVLEKLKSFDLKEGVNLFKKQLELTQLKEMGLNIEKLTQSEATWLAELQVINRRFKRLPLDHAKELLELMNRSRHSDDVLPSFQLKSEEIGLRPGHYMAKLSDDDIRAPMIGHFLDCCQHIAGDGKKTVIHAVSSEFGATYAIFKGQVSEDNKTVVNQAHDTIVFGSWVWTDGKTGICFDSAEFSNINNTLTEDESNVFYTEYAQRLLEKSPESIKKVTVGTHGRTPENFGHGALKIKHMSMLKPIESNGFYTGYRDSNAQRILAHREFSKYYAMHQLNYVESLVELHQIDDRDIQMSLSMNHGEKLKELKLDSMPIPAWLTSIMTCSQFNIESFEKDLNPNLGLYIEKEGCTVAVLFIRQAGNPENCWNRIDLYSLLEKHLSAELCNSGSDARSILLEAMGSYYHPISLINAMFEKGADPNIGDIDGKNFAFYFFNRKVEEFDPKWISHYKLDLNHQDDNGCSPLVQYAEASSSYMKLCETFLSHGADPNLQDREGNSFLHCIARNYNWLTAAPIEWIEKYQFNLTLSNIFNETPLSIALRTVGTVHKRYSRGTLAEYFTLRYIDNIDAVQSYDDLWTFVRAHHDTNPIGNPWVGLKLIDKLCCYPIIERLLSTKADPSNYLSENWPSYFCEIASNIHPHFPTRWYQYFNIENELERKLQFRMFALYTWEFQHRHTSLEDYRYYYGYARKIAANIRDSNDLPRVLEMLKGDENSDPPFNKTNSQIFLLWLLHHYKIDVTFLMDIFYSTYGDDMPFLLTRNVFSHLSLNTVHETGLDRYCISKNLPSLSFLLLRDYSIIGNDHGLVLFDKACQQVLGQATSFFELLDIIQRLVDTYRSIEPNRKAIFKRQISRVIERATPYELDDYRNQQTIIQLFIKMGLYAPLETIQSKPMAEPWCPPISLLFIRHLYLDCNDEHTFHSTIALISARLSTPEDLMELSGSIPTDRLPSVMDRLSYSVFRHSTHINHLIKLLEFFLDKNKRCESAEISSAVLHTVDIFPLIKNYNDYKKISNFMLLHHHTFSNEVLKSRETVETLYAVIDKLRSEVPGIPVPNSCTLRKTIDDNNMKEFFMLCDKYPLLNKCRKVAYDSKYVGDGGLDQLIKECQSMKPSSTKKGFALVYHQHSQNQRRLRVNQKAEVNTPRSPQNNR